ncbi:MAG: ABC transporter substrate-binding protein [Bacillota bacterium]
MKQTDRPTPTRRRDREHPRDRLPGWVFAIALLALFVTGTLGGYRYQAGQWPWEPALSVTANGPDQADPPAVNIPGPSAGEPDPDLERYMRSVVSLNVRGEQGSKSGSGFIIDGGKVVTSAHVIEGYRGCINVIDDNGTSHLGTVINLDRNLDVALVDVPTLKWPDAFSLRETPLAPGDGVYVLGSPKDTPNAALLQAEVQQVGVAKRIDDRYYGNLVEFKGATVVHGASGSPLLHRETGEVAGVVTAAADTPVAYAVPIDAEIRRLLQEWAASPAPAACGSPAPVQTVRLVLAAVAPLSGAHGVWGNDLASGAELALRDMESDLRKVGYEVSLARYDDQGRPETAREVAKMLAYDQEVVGVVGSFTSQVSAALAEVLAETGLVTIAPTAGAEELTARGWPHFNRLIASNARLEAAAATFAKNSLKARAILLILDGSAAAESRAASFETSAQIISLPVAGRLTLSSPPVAAELKEQVLQSGADAIYYAGNSQIGFQVAQALREEGITLPIIGGADLYSSAFRSITTPTWRGIYFTHFTNGRDERFERHFQNVLGKPSRGYGMFGYDAARVILEALVRYGGEHPARVPSRSELAELVRSTRAYPGWSSTITFDPLTGENQAARVFVFEWVQGQHELRE